MTNMLLIIQWLACSKPAYCGQSTLVLWKDNKSPRQQITGLGTDGKSKQLYIAESALAIACQARPGMWILKEFARWYGIEGRDTEFAPRTSTYAQNSGPLTRNADPHLLVSNLIRLVYRYIFIHFSID
ncbi:hypothetical protein OnM2_01656 [Erysiphe neolycopersici]|uniref:Uncharacterized protein n=1 Tax=Erysiphe neolycopersici TaxID=212602 RepID=A0A420HSY2_9PEZI|nr:hypothetical protein OnM2_01656 [Erysiphe neolycopersici]